MVFLRQKKKTLLWYSFSSPLLDKHTDYACVFFLYLNNKKSNFTNLILLYIYDELNLQLIVHSIK